MFYLLWAFVPSEYLEFVGIDELPDKYFILFLPVMALTATTIFAFFIYPALSFISTTNIDSVYTIKDESSISRCAHVDEDGVMCNRKIFDSQKYLWKKYFECTDHRTGQTITNAFCDCSGNETCSLNDKYLENLRRLQNRQNSASDLNIFEVSKNLYGN